MVSEYDISQGVDQDWVLSSQNKEYCDNIRDMSNPGKILQDFNN